VEAVKFFIFSTSSSSKVVFYRVRFCFQLFFIKVLPLS